MPRTPARRVPHVAVLIETSREYGRGLLAGVARYLRERGRWSVYFTPQGLQETVPPFLRNWQGDGILARIDNRHMARTLLATGLPLIDLRGRLPRLGVPNVGLDNGPVATMAFEHLRARGFRHYGFCGLPRGEHVHMDQRHDYFGSAVEAAGFRCAVFCPSYHPDRPIAWEKEQQQLGDWLLSLPKPIGIMTCNDDRGQQLLDACRRASVLVPDEVAVIGVDNDQVLCSLATPPMSSVETNPQRSGYEAAALLDRMMAGLTDPPAQLLFPPSHVVTRLSTDTLAIEDPVVARALRFIRDHACDGINVGDVVDAVVVSRRLLERQMRALLGRSPNEEILRVRIERVKLLLLESACSMKAIAQKTGFRNDKYLGEVFLRVTGKRPGAFRRESRD